MSYIIHMKYIVFSNRVEIDKFIQEGPDALINSNYPYDIMKLDMESNGDEDFVKAFHKIEEHGSFCFISEKKYVSLDINRSD